MPENTNGQGDSGGRAVAYHAGGKIITDSSITSKAPDARLFHTGYGGWEPTLGITRRGEIFMDARNSNTDPEIIHSTDGGRTWTGSRPCSHVVSLDPYMWVDRRTGRVFDSDINATVTCAPVSFTDNGGRTWTTRFSCGEADHETIFGGPPPAGGTRPHGYPDVVYFCAISGGIATRSVSDSCSRSLDGGLTFAPTRQLPYGTNGPAQTSGPRGPACGGGTGHGVVDSVGIVYLPRGRCGVPEVAISRDEGITWQRVEVAPGSMPVQDGVYAHEAGIGVDGRGNAYYVWVDGRRRVRLAISHDRGVRWSKPMDITPPGARFAALPGIDVGAPGKIAIVFVATRDRTLSDATTWNGYMVESANALARRPTWYGASINGPSHNPLWIGSDCGPRRCGAMGDFFDVVIGPDGVARAALVDACPDESAEDCGTTGFVRGIRRPRGEAILGVLLGGPTLR